VVDAIAHEYEFGDGDHMAGSRSQMDWFLYQVGMLSFRGFAQGKATWLLNYSWDGDKDVDKREAMKTLAASQVMLGVNFWDAPGHSMGGSNDPATRTEIFKWIEKHERTLYYPRKAIQPVGVYFSPESRNYDAAHFLPSYRGTILMLLQAHREIQVVTPRTLGEFHGSALILPDVSAISDVEGAELKKFVDGGGRVVLEGKNVAGLPESPLVTKIPSSPGVEHLAKLQKDFAGTSQSKPMELLRAVPENKDLKIEVSPLAVSYPAVVDGKLHIFFANFSGIVPHRVVKPTPESSASVTLTAGPKTTLTFLPFLGEEQTIAGKAAGSKMTFHLPAFDRGAVVWVNESK